MDLRLQTIKNKSKLVVPFLVIGAAASFLWSSSKGRIGTICFGLIILGALYLVYFR